MRGVNKAIIIGNLGKDPELRYTATGTPVAKFSVATSESWTNKQTNTKEEKTEWHNIVVWGKMAEICGEYLKKGRPVYLEGRIQTRKWEDKEGNNRYSTEIVANNVQFLGGRDAGQGQSSYNADKSFDDSPTDMPMPPEPPSSGGAFAADDDIPF
jgi:single-strand DNA-binding protein